MHTKSLKKLQIAASVLTVFFGVSTLVPLLASAQAETSSIGEQVTPITFNFDATPANFTFSAVNIDNPTQVYSSYYVNPQTRDDSTSLIAHDGRYNGGFKVTVQADDFVKTGNNAIVIPASQLSLVTAASNIDEVLKDGTTPAAVPMEGDPSDGSTDYDQAGHQFTSPGGIDIISAPATCGPEGRVGTYQTYPSFKLHIPNNTPAGNYTSTLTYTITADPTPC